MEGKRLLMARCLKPLKEFDFAASDTHTRSHPLRCMPLILLILLLFMTKLYPACKGRIICIETVPNPENSSLRVKAKPVSFPLSAEDRELIKTLKEMTVALGGVGLAAPQIDVSKRVAAIYIPEEAAKFRDNIEPEAVHVILNAEYEALLEEGTDPDFEGCYSVESRMGKVPRAKAIRVCYDTEEGVRIESIERGFYARVLQHEIDHLNGILMIDRLTPDCPQGSLEEMLELRKQELQAQGKDTQSLDETLGKIKGIRLKETPEVP